MMKHEITAAAVVAACTLLGTLQACHPREPISPPAGLTADVNPPKQPDLGRYPARVSVEVLNMYWGENVMSVCKGPAPFFEFDSAHVGPDDKSTIQLLADCMATGPLQGKKIELVGRTDPRGSEEYNEQLGLERAERVKRYLVSHGISAERVKTTSLGKQDASPAPKDWAGDRRVEIRLAQ